MGNEGIALNADKMLKQVGFVPDDWQAVHEKRSLWRRRVS